MGVHLPGSWAAISSFSSTSPCSEAVQLTFATTTHPSYHLDIQISRLPHRPPISQQLRSDGEPQALGKAISLRIQVRELSAARRRWFHGACATTLLSRAP